MTTVAGDMASQPYAPATGPQREETLSQRSAHEGSSDEEEADDDIDHAHILHNLQGSEALQSLADQTRQAPSGHAGDRARSLFVTQWLLENYETHEGHSLPRSTLFLHYAEYCRHHGIEATNAASFGKLIRSVFQNIKTRRLGTRGKSKYHYCGIRLKTDAHPQQHQPAAQDNGIPDGVPEEPVINRPPMQLPNFPTFVMQAVGLQAVDPAALQGFVYNYRSHCQNFLNLAQLFKFGEIEPLLNQFWSDSWLHFRALFTSPYLVDYIAQCDHILFQTAQVALIPDVLQPTALYRIQSIRTFAKRIELWLTEALNEFPDIFKKKKLEDIHTFAQHLRRLTSLNHLAQSANGILADADQMQQMSYDWGRHDFASVIEQASWVCNCQANNIRQIESDFKQLLNSTNKLEHWISWLHGVIYKFLGDKARDAQQFLLASRQFALNFSMYSSLVMRNLTLRGASSFGSFHLIRLLFDEYIFYVIEQRLWLLNNVRRQAAMENNPNSMAMAQQGAGIYGGASSLQQLMVSQHQQQPPHQAPQQAAPQPSTMRQ